MNHIEFIEKNVREELIRQGVTQSVAQGGHFRLSICTSACHRPVVREAFLMMLCATPGCGLRSKPALQKSEKQRNQSVRGITRLGCFKGESRGAATPTAFRCKNEEVIAR